MRINIYAEEVTDEIEVVQKHVSDEKFGERSFYGIRIYLKSPPELHSDPEDDDRSAITFWVPATNRGTVKPEVLRSMFVKLLDALADVAAP